MVTRRSLLASCGRVTAVGALLGVAGCVDRAVSGRGGDPDPETDERVTTEAPDRSSDERSERPDFAGHLDDANGFDGAVADMTGEAEVTIEVGAGDAGYAFSPPAVHVDVGTTLRWEWTGDGGAHHVLSTDDGPLDSGVAVAEPGVHYEFTAEEDGIYNYYCNPHQGQGMLGSVVVGTDYPTTTEPYGTDDEFDHGEGDSDDVADDQGHYLDDANGYDGGMPTDRRGQDVVTVAVGAGNQGYGFDPVAVVVDAGTTVRWEWTGDGGAHNVVGRDNVFYSGSPEAGDDTAFEYTFTESGSHMYGCIPHEAAGMKGAVVVAPEREAGETTVISAEDTGA